jgi:hypothetical protein
VEHRLPVTSYPMLFARAVLTVPPAAGIVFLLLSRPERTGLLRLLGQVDGRIRTGESA